MKKLLNLLCIGCIVMACNNNEADTATKDPSEVHPPSEALPDTLKLVNDSVVVADSAADPDVKARVGASDSIQSSKH